MQDAQTKYGSSTIPPNKAKQSKSTLRRFSVSVVIFSLGMFFGFIAGHYLAYYLQNSPMFVGIQDSNFTIMLMSTEHLEVVIEVGQFLQLLEEVDESLSYYSDSIVHQLSDNIRKGIADLEELRESTKPKERRRPPLDLNQNGYYLGNS